MNSTNLLDTISKTQKMTDEIKIMRHTTIVSAFVSLTEGHTTLPISKATSLAHAFVFFDKTKYKKKANARTTGTPC